jgi:hypothetical protein
MLRLLCCRGMIGKGPGLHGVDRGRRRQQTGDYCSKADLPVARRISPDRNGGGSVGEAVKKLGGRKQG